MGVQPGSSLASSQGFIGSKIVNKTGEGLVLELIAGVVGAVVDGFIFNPFGNFGVTRSTFTACWSQ